MISSMKGPTRGKCTFGFIRRRSYSYKKKSGKNVFEKGKPGSGRGSSRKIKILPKLKKGSLTSLGYGIREKTAIRHAALKKALKKYGYSSLIKKLNILVVYNKNAHPDISSIAHSDMMFVEQLANRL
jgi:hypothetical protein